MNRIKSVRMTSNPSLTIALLALAALIATGLTMSDRFGTFRNFANLLEQSAPLGILALGQMLVVLAGGIDLSIGAIVTASAVVIATFCKAYPELAPLIIVATLFLGILLGAINGFIINQTGVHPLIVTLGTSSAINGLVLLYTMRPVGSVPIWLEDFTYGATLGVPNVAIVMFVVFIAVAIFLRRTATGHAVYAVGGNDVAATAAGLSVKRITLLVYSASGFLAALAGVYFASRTGTGDPRVGDAMTLASITPVVVGGTVLGGGVGGVFGTFVGVALVSVLGNVLNYMNVSTFVQWVIQGIVILAAVSLYVDRNRKI
ncbi:ABC transporter permease [Brucella sp. NBRC 12950]|uniref:ABC transporter permease n=1 Tax=Brucella sp. NBRC 12950 TaxID=2994518 RepID=UPI0024A3156B|nr:ABC transporter permease [Brucella sp. NBRC 12950]GLU30030.1 ABC transporter permease [Brucella sp. NBRC 12950]